MISFSASSAALCIVAIQSEAAWAQEQPWTFDLHGQLRERYESANNPVFGLSPPVQNDYLLHRATLAAEGRQASHLRARVELSSSLTSGWRGRPPPTQENPLDVLQAFIETPLPAMRGQASVRVGRQELALGSSRLVSVRESPNVRRTFDGIRTTWSQDNTGTATAFFVRPVFPEDGAFDDRSSHAERFWGAYATWSAPALEGLEVDTYYLGLDRAHAVFAQGKARERRHSVGTRAFGERAGWDWDIEAIWQWGSFGDSGIRAWTASVHVGFELAALPMAPRIGLKADAISGDEDLRDHRLGTFNPLFPKLPYFSEANLATPANLLDIQPSVRLSLTKRLTATLGWNRLWKHETADAFYEPLLSPVQGTSLTRSRDIGWQASALVEWRPTAQFEVGATYVTFAPGTVMREAGGRTGKLPCDVAALDFLIVGAQ